MGLNVEFKKEVDSAVVLINESVKGLPEKTRKYALAKAYRSFRERKKAEKELRIARENLARLEKRAKE